MADLIRPSDEAGLALGAATRDRQAARLRYLGDGRGPLGGRLVDPDQRDRVARHGAAADGSSHQSRDLVRIGSVVEDSDYPCGLALAGGSQVSNEGGGISADAPRLREPAEPAQVGGARECVDRQSLRRIGPGQRKDQRSQECGTRSPNGEGVARQQIEADRHPVHRARQRGHLGRRSAKFRIGVDGLAARGQPGGPTGRNAPGTEPQLHAVSSAASLPEPSAAGVGGGLRRRRMHRSGVGPLARGCLRQGAAAAGEMVAVAGRLSRPLPLAAPPCRPGGDEGGDARQDGDGTADRQEEDARCQDGEANHPQR